MRNTWLETGLLNIADVFYIVPFSVQFPSVALVSICSWISLNVIIQ